jgi:hypothetical protein
MTATAIQPVLSVSTPQVTQKGVWVEVVHTHHELRQLLTAWRDLAAQAAEINAFYEPAMLLPAAEHVHQNKDLAFALIYHAVGDGTEPSLIGLVPLERLHGYRGLPTKYWRLWEYDYCFLCTPLMRKDHVRNCWRALFDWVNGQPEAFLELPYIPAEGVIYQQLVELVRHRGLVTFDVEKSTRAIFKRRSSADQYLQQSLTADKRRDLNRKWRRLQEQGTLEFRTLTEATDLPQWIEQFLRLEASGWKGQEHTAIASKPYGPAYFQAMAETAFSEGQLLMLGLFLNGEPLAIRCNFVSAPGSFFFKPAYNEAYAKFSPGVHVELETIRILHERAAISWMDSCTSPDNTLLNSLWLERRVFHTVQIARSRWGGFLIGAVQPALRWFNRLLGRYQYQEY